MRLGLSSPLAHSGAEQWAEQMVKLGCKSVNFPIACNDGEDKINAYAKAAADHDLMIAEVGIWRNAISLDEQERNAAMDYSIAQLRLADRLKARCCVNITGSTGARWDGPYRENYSKETWDRSVRMIQEIIDEAKPQNTYFTIEPMPWMYPSSPEEYVKLMEDVNRERFAVHLDPMNMINTPERYFFTEKFLDRTFELLGDKIKSCHIKDVHLRQEFTFQLQETMVGQGEFPLQYYAKKINELDPEMPVILEHLNLDDEYRKGIAYLHKILGE